YRIKFDKEYSVNYLPEGYYAIEEIRNSTLLGVNFENNNGDQIIFQQHLDYTVANADSEGAKTEYIKIGEHKGILYTEGEYKVIVWKSEKYFLEITSNNTSREEMIKIANSVK
ncbi:MAG: DUF4367 domain-containing protein, partial [Eubacterium sp.]